MWARGVTNLLTFGLLITLTVAKPSPQNDNNGAVQQDRTGANRQLNALLENKIENTPFRLAEGMNSFSNDIYSQLSLGSGNNIAFSPFSMHTALAMTFFGSPEESRTHMELANILGMRTRFYEDYSYNFLKLLKKYDDLSQANNGAVLSVANRIFTDDSLTPKEDFVQWLNVFYRANVETVDFGRTRQAAGSINNFVSQKTRGIINKVINEGDIDSLTRMVLVNALYFKANWQYQFKPRLTKSGPFTVEPGQTFNYPKMMTTRGEFGLANLPEISARMLELPYSHPDLRMLVILPNEGVDIRDVDSNLDRLDMGSIDRRLTFGQVLVQIPSFEASAQSEMSAILTSLGVKTLFDPSSADLSDIVETEKLSVDKVIHQVVVKVNEEGSEAAAATAVAIGTRTVGSSTRSFRANRPFIFIIQDKEARIPLFVGRIIDPSGQRSLTSRTQPNSVSQAQEAASIVGGNIGNLPLPPFQLEVSPAQEPQTQAQEIQEEEEGPEFLRREEEGAVAVGDPVEEFLNNSPPPAVNPADEFGGAVVVQADGVPDERDLSECDETTGFRTVNERGEITFPCAGRETAPVNDHMRAQEAAREMRINQFLNAQNQ